jgi:N6-L-threonylcarbamoyladenine synthase
MNELILGIDTSCDDTSAAIVSGNRVLSNVISSQMELHRKYGGVVPIIARRNHEENIDAVVKEALVRAGKTSGRELELKDIAAVAVTYGPGLAIALEVGIKKAKQLSAAFKIPLIAVNHMEGHLLSPLAANSKGKAAIDPEKVIFPVLGVLISGGHTELVLVSEIGKQQKVGQKLDDAIGEAYDKVARMLGLGYPGGAALSEFAKKGDPHKHQLPVPMAKSDNLDFSYSGLKTAVYYRIKELTEDGSSLSKRQVYDFAASFEAAAIAELQIKLEKALKKYGVKTVLVGGGVAQSAKVRRAIRAGSKKFGATAYFPNNRRLYTDNAAMIALVGNYKCQRKEFADQTLDRDPRASL